MSHPVYGPLHSAARCGCPVWSPKPSTEEQGLWAGAEDAHAGGAAICHLVSPDCLLSRWIQARSPPWNARPQEGCHAGLVCTEGRFWWVRAAAGAGSPRAPPCTEEMPPTVVRREWLVWGHTEQQMACLLGSEVCASLCSGRTSLPRAERYSLHQGVALKKKEKEQRIFLGKLPLKPSHIQTALLEGTSSFQNGVPTAEMQYGKLFS